MMATAALLLVHAAESDGGVNLMEFARALAKRVARHVGGGCMILLRTEAEEFMPVAVDHCRAEPRASLQWLCAAHKAALSSSFTQKLLQTGEPIAMPVVSSATLRLWVHPSFHCYLERYAVSSVLSVPLKHGGQIVGSIAVWREEPRVAFGDDDLLLIEDVARHIGDQSLGWWPQLSARA
jgi:GAF domain-containing protein